MYVPMIFIGNPWDRTVTVRAARVRPLKSLSAAKALVEKNIRGGYVKQLGVKIPVFHHIGV